MWVFGYGSLMWDGWEVAWGCTRRVLADLPRYSRAFSKASIKNWGTKDAPCPTLNLSKQDTSVCRGIAFEFPDEHKKDVLNYLTKREGTGLRSMSVILQGSIEVSAFVAIYDGTNLIKKSLEETASLVRKAKGRYGSCFAYVKGITEKLADLGVDDPVVTEFWRAVNDHAPDF